jgi:hypothetical protein
MEGRRGREGEMNSSMFTVELQTLSGAMPMKITLEKD